MQSRWFLFGAVVGFVLLLFEMGKHGSSNGYGGSSQAGSVPGKSGCGCGGTQVTAEQAPVADTAPATANPGGAGLQYATPTTFVPYQRPGWGIFAPGSFPVSPNPAPGQGAEPVYGNSAKPLPGATVGAY